MVRLAALVFSAWVLLAGCTGPTYTYSKPEGSPTDFKRDSYACVQESRVSWKMCMEARGWTAEASR